MVFSDLDYVSKTDITHVIRYWKTGKFSRLQLRLGWMPPHPTIYIKRDVFDRIGLYNTKYLISADYDLILRCLSNTNRQPVYIPEVLYKMRVGGVSNYQWV